MATPIVGITPLTAVFFLGFSVGKRLQQTHANEELRYGTKEENRFMYHYVNNYVTNNYHLW